MFMLRVSAPVETTELVELDQSLEIVRCFAVQAARRREAFGHRPGQIALAGDHQLQVIGSPESDRPREGAIREPALLLGRVEVSQKGAVIEVAKDIDRAAPPGVDPAAHGAQAGTCA